MPITRMYWTAVRAAVHLAIGRLLSSRTAKDELEEKIFEIVNQLDRGAALITSREERERVAELNLVAAKRATRSIAYASALRYLEAGAALLADDRWERRYELSFAIERHRAECEFLIGELSAVEERLSTLWCRAGDLVDMAAVAYAQIALYATQGRYDRAIDTGLHYLRLVGIELSPRPTAAEIEQEYERLCQQLGGRPMEELLELPPMTEPCWQATMDILLSLAHTASFSDERLLCLTECRMVNLSLCFRQPLAIDREFWRDCSAVANRRDPSLSPEFQGGVTVDRTPSEGMGPTRVQRIGICGTAPEQQRRRGPGAVPQTSG
ncbi:hypothetical protein ACMHYB_33580 [Sorangium sp. So ce1128]